LSICHDKPRLAQSNSAGTGALDDPLSSAVGSRTLTLVGLPRSRVMHIHLRNTYASRLAFAVAAFYAAVVHAQSAAQPVTISYQAPLQCPSKDELLVAIRVRMQELQKADFDATQAVDVSIVRVTAGFNGQLTIFVDGGQVLKRSLQDSHCGALVEGLALVTAMALAPTVANGQGRTHHALPSAATHQQNLQLSTPPLSITEQPREFDLMLAALGGLQTAPTPENLLSAGVHLALWPRRRAQRLGMSLIYGQTGQLAYSSGQVRFRWLITRIIGCPVGLRHRSLSVMACGMVEVGLLRGEPQGAVSGTSRNGFWLAPGLGGQTSVQHSGVVLEMFAGVVRPLVRDEFFFAGLGQSAQNETVHHPPALGLVAELRLGTLF